MQWIQDNDHWLTIVGIVSAVMFVASLILIPLIIIRLPSDYFSAPHRKWLRTHPVFIPLFIVQHIIGATLFLAGILMLVLPGQGILSMVLGLSLISFPGKHRMLQKIFSKPRVNRSMNWIRQKAKVSLFTLPQTENSAKNPPPANG